MEQTNTETLNLMNPYMLHVGDRHINIIAGVCVCVCVCVWGGGGGGGGWYVWERQILGK